MPDLTQLNKHPLNQRALELLNEMKENPEPISELHLFSLMMLSLQDSPLNDAEMETMYQLDQTKLMEVAKESLTLDNLKGLNPRQAGFLIAERLGLV